MTTRIRYGGFPFMKTPKIESLSEETQKMLLERVQLDGKLYAAARDRFIQAMEAEGPSFQQELVVYRRTQRLLRKICTEHKDHPACIWYKLNDIQFVRMIPRAYATAVPFDL